MAYSIYNGVTQAWLGSETELIVAKIKALHAMIVNDLEYVKIQSESTNILVERNKVTNEFFFYEYGKEPRKVEL